MALFGIFIAPIAYVGAIPPGPADIAMGTAALPHAPEQGGQGGGAGQALRRPLGPVGRSVQQSDRRTAIGARPRVAVSGTWPTGP